MDENLSQALAAVLRAEKGAQNVTSREIAERTGFAEVSISRWLNGKRELDVEKLATIAKALGTSAAELMKRAEERMGWQDDAADGHEVVTFPKE